MSASRARSELIACERAKNHLNTTTLPELKSIAGEHFYDYYIRPYFEDMLENIEENMLDLVEAVAQDAELEGDDFEDSELDTIEDIDQGDENDDRI